MNDENRSRCERLAYDSKKGKRITDDDLEFLTKMWVNHPVEYKAIQKEVIERATAELNPLFSEEHS